MNPVFGILDDFVEDKLVNNNICETICCLRPSERQRVRASTECRTEHSLDNAMDSE